MVFLDIFVRNQCCHPIALMQLMYTVWEWHLCNCHLLHIKTMTHLKCNIRNYKAKVVKLCLCFRSVTNHHILRGLARVGCGSYEYLDSSTKSKWQRKVGYIYIIINNKTS